MEILFFSRGRGRGHAIPDVGILTELKAIRPTLNCELVSYAIGARTIESLGERVIDLGLPEENPFLETLIKAATIIENRKPQLVVAHEEPAAVLASKVFGIPSVFITDWFMKETSILMQSLSYAQRVIFLEAPAIFDEPSFLRNRVKYMGSFLRNFTYSKSDRNLARHELAIDLNTFVVSVLPGGWATEIKAPALDLILTAFDRLQFGSKLLLWVAGSDYEDLRDRTSTRNDIRIYQQSWPIERVMVASDVIVTKNNRGTTLEAAQLGIGSLSLSHGLNPVEDYIVPRIRSNLSLRIKGLDSAFLATCVEQQALKTKDLSPSLDSTVSARSIANEIVTSLA